MPKLGGWRVDAITNDNVMAVLLPIWSTKRITAQRVRQRIGAVMKWAVAKGYRQDNPAGDAIAAALKRVRESEGYAGSVLTFEFLVLTATRSAEARGLLGRDRPRRSGLCSATIKMSTHPD